MIKYILKRLLLAIPLLMAITVITFAILHAVPGDPSDILINPRTPRAERERIKHNLGLDKPVYIQYFIWLKNLTLHGDMGYSMIDGKPVLPTILERFPHTLTLMGASYVLSILIAIPLGVLAAVHKNSFFDYILTFFSFIGLSIPSFWLALISIYFFVELLGWFPSVGTGSTVQLSWWGKITDYCWHMFLPTLVLTFRNLAEWSRYIRSSMVEVLEEDYIRTAKALGIPQDTIIYKYALKSAFLPMITLIGLTLPNITAGSFVIEFLFGWPGIGRLGIEAVGKRDYPILMGDILIASLFIIIANLIADMLYAWADPRIRIRE